MHNISIFCKSYINDLDRVATLVESIQKYNFDAIPLFISVPRLDLDAFKNRIGNDLTWLTDEEIIEANPNTLLSAYLGLPGQLSQQIVKAEFWRINPVENYLCVDSDMRFIRDFSTQDFVSPDGVLYTILHEGKDLLEFWAASHLHQPLNDFVNTARVMQQRFGRSGPLYNFGPFPVIWSAKVWQRLSDMLDSEGSNILKALVTHPHEASWYGETLLKFQPIRFLPKEPIFKAYLFLEDYERDQRLNLNEQLLANFYLGVVYQSNWYPKRLQPLKKFAYKVKRLLGRH